MLNMLHGADLDRRLRLAAKQMLACKGDLTARAAQVLRADKVPVFQMPNTRSSAFLHFSIASIDVRWLNALLCFRVQGVSGPGDRSLFCI
jgi:hypothetical protein